MKKLTFVLSLASVFSVYAQVDTPQTPKELNMSFSEAVEIGLKENVSYRREKNQLEIQQATKLREHFRYLPDISASARYTQIDGQQFNQVQGIVAFTKSDNINASINMNLNLFEGFGRIKSIKQANYNFKAQINAVDRARQQLIFDIAQQYLQILLSQELLRIASDNLDVQRTTLSQIEGQVEAGALAKPDLYTQEAQVDQVDVLRLRAKNTLRNNKTTLMQTLQLEPVVEIVTSEPDWSVEDIIALDYDLNSLYEIAMQNRPDYKQTVDLVKANKMGIGVATSGYYPTLSAFFSYGSNYSNLVANSTFIETGEFETIGFVNGNPNQPVSDVNPSFIRVNEEVSFDTQFFDDNPASFIGLNLSIPIFDRFQTRTNRVIAKLQHQNAKLDEQNLRRTVFLDVQNAYLDFLASKTDYFASQKQFEAAEKALEVQKERLRLGVGNLVEYSQANNIYIQGAASKAQSEYTLLFQKIILDFVLGTLKYEGLP
ncbi:MAG: TolC family protein [Bacteroidota bacterium]